MILTVEVEPGVVQIYQAQAAKLGTTTQELMASVLAFWPAAQWDMKAAPAAKPTSETKTDNSPFGAGY